MAKRILDLFIFTSIYIGLCAVFMVYQTVDLLHLAKPSGRFYFFVFFSTLCSYNFHWYLTPSSPAEQNRVRWTQEHKKLHLALFIIGLVGAAYFSLVLISHILWIGVGVALTFLYSAPKIAMPPFNYLKKIAVGKTIFLTFVWMYVTTTLPVILSSSPFSAAAILFCISRFFLIYPICIIFDYRDRINDRIAGIKSMITLFSEQGVNRLFYISLFCFLIATVCLAFTGFSFLVIFFLLVPGAITLALFQDSKTNFSDYRYYLVLDGLMMFSAIFTSLI